MAPMQKGEKKGGKKKEMITVEVKKEITEEITLTRHVSGQNCKI